MVVDVDVKMKKKRSDSVLYTGEKILMLTLSDPE
jgi:hypothetical protein